MSIPGLPQGSTDPIGYIETLLSQAGLNAKLFLKLMLDRRVKKRYKILIPMVVYLYLKKGKDIIPDSIPVLGQLDDIAVVALGLTTFFKKVPPEVIQEHLKALSKEKVPRTT